MLAASMLAAVLVPVAVSFAGACASRMKKLRASSAADLESEPRI